MPKAITDALAAWRDAERRLKLATDGDGDRIRAEVVYHRGVFHQLSAEYMVGRIDALRDAEQRRHAAVPSTDEFHRAAKDEMTIAHEIFDVGWVSDQETPRRDS